MANEGLRRAAVPVLPKERTTSPPQAPSSGFLRYLQKVPSTPPPPTARPLLPLVAQTKQTVGRGVSGASVGVGGDFISAETFASVLVKNKDKKPAPRGCVIQTPKIPKTKEDGAGRGPPSLVRLGVGLPMTRPVSSRWIKYLDSPRRGFQAKPAPQRRRPQTGRREDEN